MSNTKDMARIRGRITVKGRLRLDTPLLIGEGASGEERDDRDIHVLRGKDGVPFIPGTSLAGALRTFVEEDDADAAQLLFGASVDRPVSTTKTGEYQSAISLYDVLLKNAKCGIRDGVSIDEDTGRAIDGHKYDYEIVEEGAAGVFYAEILLRALHEPEQERWKAALLRLRDLLRSGFHVGALTTKGFGRIHIEDMEIDGYDFRRREDTLAWLSPQRGHGSFHWTDDAPSGAAYVYGADDFIIEADFALTGSLIVRDKEGANQEIDGRKTPDALMKKNAAGQYIIPGTSLKGVLRHRAAFILHALGKDPERIDALMGASPTRMKELPHGAKRRSRFIVEEAVVTGKAHVQNRIRIDRFTGGTIPSALFSTEPLWQTEQNAHAVTLRFGVKRMGKEQVKPWEAGLCILLLKDLWLGRIAIGGEKSIGRGTLKGLRAIIRYKDQKWILSNAHPIGEKTATELQTFVTALDEEVDA